MDCVFRPLWKTSSYGNFSQLLPERGKLPVLGYNIKGAHPPHQLPAPSYTGANPEPPRCLRGSWGCLAAAQDQALPRQTAGQLPPAASPVAEFGLFPSPVRDQLCSRLAFEKLKSAASSQFVRIKKPRGILCPAPL